MAPRRLIIVMLVLLAFSTALALLVPEPRPPDGSNGQGGTGTDRSRQSSSEEDTRKQRGQPEATERDPVRKEDPRPGARTIEATVRAGGAVRQITIRRGDRLVIEVRSGKPIVVAIPGAGLVDSAGPYDPARFDLLARTSNDRLSVEDLDSGRKLARIKIG